MSRIWILLAALFMVSTSESGAAPLCENQLSVAALKEGVPLGLLYAVALTETGSEGKLSPFAMNVDGKAVISPSREHALEAYYEERRRGAQLVDVGCMQINVHYHAKEFASVNDMFDPQQNVAYAARFLKTLKARHGSWTAAVARYHAGPQNRPAQKRYVCNVLRNLVRLGFGAATQESEAYCR